MRLFCVKNKALNSSFCLRTEQLKLHMNFTAQELGLLSTMKR